MTPRCTIKVNLRKAYDSVHWSFIEDMLNALNFPPVFISWIMVCVSSPSFSIMINGGMFGFFKGKQGVRHGDPLSPLIFVLVMEYLSRLLIKSGRLRHFKYHQRCKSLSLNHLIFADDLMLFCHGYRSSVMLMARVLKVFEQCSGLSANVDKTAIYFGSMDTELQQSIMADTHFTKGQTPFRYLGIPLNAKYLRVTDFDSLIDKMLAKITRWSSRNLSYAARVVLVNAVLMSLHTYWAQVVLLPKAVMHRISQLCRAFLWCGNAVLSKVPPISWDWISKKEDSLWVKWVHSVYIKHADWWTYTPKRCDGWAWKRVCAVKEELKTGFLNNGWMNSKYQLGVAYIWLQGDLQAVNWDAWVWNRFNVPKHSFITWLAIQGRLRTRDKLLSYGVCSDSSCLLCGFELETKEHLFFKCNYSRHCLDLICKWLNVREIHYDIEASWKHWKRKLKPVPVPV
ncbi:uncharacterized protein LOC110716088 [Chenopodium quinoa]|uniref:uncharacterized protein LOC110716088 n=1 Tax=Chenopodium quinoa TaxID=63459 RepID=UPI000B76E059|nr:uncharacterized protein LOC110716088 [Chenopodium quinoa]